MRFEITATDPHSQARTGKLYTAHGVLQTPVFIPSASLATVKGCTPEEVAQAGIQIIACNAYHLWLRPGVEVIERAGGVHRFMGWKRPLLSDSGGFQVFSLANSREISEEGVRFRSYLDGSWRMLTPEKCMEIQNALGADIAMILDECCPYPCDQEYAGRSIQMTLEWARRCKAAHANPHQNLFGIVQGSVYQDLRRQSAEETVQVGLAGYAVGGLSVGEPRDQMLEILQTVLPLLPPDRPRYVMGVGSPEDIGACVRLGVDIFDCVLPTKNARHGSLFVPGGMLKIKNAGFRDDLRPIEEGCDCPACRGYSRAYLRHLWMAKETLGARLLTLHNLRFYARFMSELRAAIAGTGEGV